MTKKVKVAAIQIEYPDGEIKQLSIEDARELFNQLEKLFGDKTTIIPSTPIVVERERWPWRPYWSDESRPITAGDQPPALPKVWCCADDGQ